MMTFLLSLHLWQAANCRATGCHLECRFWQVVCTTLLDELGLATSGARLQLRGIILRWQVCLARDYLKYFDTPTLRGSIQFCYCYCAWWVLLKQGRWVWLHQTHLYWIPVLAAWSGLRKAHDTILEPGHSLKGLGEIRLHVYIWGPR